MKRPAGSIIEHNYEGKVLIATPSLRDGVFTRSVVYMCAHRSDGAMGIVVNQRASDVKFSKLLVQLEIVKEADAIRMPRRLDEIRVLRGGPVDTGRGFVLHSSDYTAADSTVQINDDICLTATLDILRAIAQGEGPRKAVLALGCAGWGAGPVGERDPRQRLADRPRRSGAAVRRRFRRQIRPRAGAAGRAGGAFVVRGGARVRGYPEEQIIPFT